MDLFNLAAKITLDDKDYVKGIGAAEKLGKNLAGKMSAMTVAVGNLAADMVRKGVAAINGVVTGAIDGYADYQQLIGGVETLFKGSADKVAKYAKQSFKTTGLSANQYMETVTSFSASLIKGLDGNVEDAAELANTAIIDMADNANKMGTDIQSIQNAYQGFAKQNYTMLDNLKLGYGGTAQEMVRLINDSGILEEEIKDLDGITFDQLVQAIHKIQEQMGITGTTAKEAASTISGSKASLEAAWADFLASVGGETDQAKLEEAGDNFKRAFKAYVVDNLAPALQTTLENTPELIQAVSDAITSLPNSAVSDLLSSGVDILTAGVGAAADIGGWLIDGLIGLFADAAADNSKAEELGAAIGEFIGSSLAKIVTNAGTIFSGILSIGEGLAAGLIEGLWNGLFGEGNTEVDGIREELEGKLTEVDENTIKNTALLDYMKALYEERGAAATATTEWKEALEELKTTMPDAESVFKNFGTDVEGAISHLEMLNKQMRKTAIQNALWTSLQDEYSLLAKQDIAYRKQEARYNRNQYAQEGLRQRAIDAIREAAQQQLDSLENPESISGRSRAAKLKNLISGMDETGQFDLSNYDLSELGTVLSNSLDVFKIAIEGLGEVDVETLAELYTQYGSEMQDALSQMEAGQKEIEATKQQIEDTKIAIEGFAKEMDTSFGTAEENIESGSETVKSGLDALGHTLMTWDFHKGGFIPKATGGEVPFDGFKAELHKGEVILTRKEANGLKNGSGPFGNSAMLGALQGLRNDLQNMQLVVGEKVFGNAVVDYGGHKVSGYIGRSESRFYAGYGT